MEHDVHPRSRWLPIIVVVCFLLGIVSVGRILTKTSDYTGTDFHPYWLAGHFILQHDSPYKGYLNSAEPRLPYHYIDGTTVTSGRISIPERATLPANTAAMQLLITPFALLPWGKALLAWQLLYVGLLALAVWLVLRLYEQPLWTWRSMGLLAIFYALLSARTALEIGNPGLLVFVLMLAALLLDRRRPVLAGLLLGVALSKYSLAFPLVLLWVYRRRWLSVAVAVLVQLVGVVALGLITNTSPLDVLRPYLEIYRAHTDLEGMHLAYVFSSVPAIGALVAFLSLGVWAALIRWHHARRADPLTASRFADILLLTALMLWNVLAFYHRTYDSVADILFLALMLFTVLSSSRLVAYDLSARTRRTMMGASGLALLSWILPLYALVGSHTYAQIYSASHVLALAIVLLLLYRMRPAARLHQLHEPALSAQPAALS